MTVTTEERKLYAPPPWAGEKHEIPPEKRTYALSLSTGRLVVLDEKWRPDPNKIGEFEKIADTLDNNSKYPLLTYDEARKVYADSETDDEPFSVIFAQIHGRERMTVDQIGKLAHIPRVYAQKIETKKKQRKQDLKSREDDMLKTVGVNAAEIFGAPKKKQ